MWCRTRLSLGQRLFQSWIERVPQAIAETEERRAMMVAAEQEMSARVQEMRAKRVEAEAQVPQAIAEVFRQGNIGVQDYDDLRNIQADRQMWEALATGEAGGRQESEYMAGAAEQPLIGETASLRARLRACLEHACRFAAGDFHGGEPGAPGGQAGMSVTPAYKGLVPLTYWREP
jgi:SigmaW regulon antibacterial